MWVQGGRGLNRNVTNGTIPHRTATSPRCYVLPATWTRSAPLLFDPSPTWQRLDAAIQRVSSLRSLLELIFMGCII